MGGACRRPRPRPCDARGGRPLRARPHINGVADQLSIRSLAVDLLTAGAVFHWLDAPVFLAEAQRVVRPGGALVIYSDFFTGRISEAPEVESWIKETYIPRNPAPPRGPALTSKLAAPFGFDLVGSAELETSFVMTFEEFVDYLLTQSNALASVQSGRVTEEELRVEILTEVGPLFPFPPSPGTAIFRARAQSPSRTPCEVKPTRRPGSRADCPCGARIPARRAPNATELAEIRTEH